MKKYLNISLLIVLLLITASWGSKGHRKISQQGMNGIPGGMVFLQPSWTNFVITHASDADYRKDQDPDESPRHYLDIDNYQEFVLTGVIHHSYDTMVARYGEGYVIDQGTLPWATLRTYDSLKSCFLRGDWNRSSLFAADLGHYVGDGHMPLHITRNYNGQYSGQTGIHSRYESSMISRYESQLVYSADSVVYIADITAYVFKYLYRNYRYVDSILLADTYATTIAGTPGTDAYYQALWQRSGNFTVELMRRGSNSLASLVYTAWVDAGSPRIYPNGQESLVMESKPASLQILPNPAGETATFRMSFPIAKIGYTLEIHDMGGNMLEMLSVKPEKEGVMDYRWKTGNLPDGSYICLLRSGAFTMSRKFIISR